MAEAENVDYGESQVETTIVSSNHATIESLVEMGEEIYKKVLRYCKQKQSESDVASVPTSPFVTAKSKSTDIFDRLKSREKPLSSAHLHASATRRNKKPDEDVEVSLENTEYRELVKQLQTEYKDFNASFPIFIRWTVQTGEFDKDALREFLRKHASTKLMSMEDFLNLQATYVVYLYQKLNPKWDTTKVQKLKSDLVQSLLKENKTFKDTSEVVDKEMKKITDDQIKFVRDQLRLIALEKKKKAEEALKSREISVVGEVNAASETNVVSETNVANEANEESETVEAV